MLQEKKLNDEDYICAFNEVSTFLAHYLKGLGGTTNKLSINQNFYTDSETIYLPESISSQQSKESSKKLFQIILSHLWAQNFYGTWNNRILSKIEAHRDTHKEVFKIFYRLECIRIEACLKRDLPGLWRQYQPFKHRDEHNTKIWDNWKKESKVLLNNQSTSFTSLSLISQFLKRPLPKLEVFQHEFQTYNLQEILDKRKDDQR